MLLLAAAAAVGWFLTRDRPATPARQAAVHRCPTVSPAPAPLQPSQVPLVLLNGTSRNNLAKTVGAQLLARGFAKVDAANAPAALPGASQVAYGPGGLPAAALVSRYVLGAQTVSDPSLPAGAVQVTLGSDFRRLASPAEAAPAPSATPSPC